MFESARIRLTIWYLLIIMSVSIVFSVVLYRVLSVEVQRALRAQKIRQELHAPHFFGLTPQTAFEVNPELVKEANNHLKLVLLAVNLAIFGLSGVAAYFLAGRTLQPIQEMLDEQNRFISDASHELRTPLTALKSEIEVNLRDKKLTLKQAKELLQSNLEEVNSLKVLSDALLELVATNKPVALVFGSVSTGEIIKDAQKKVLPLAKQKQITLTTTGLSQTIEAEKQLLTEVLVILLDNAIKYSPEKTNVEILTWSKDHSVVIAVKDQGIGVDEADIPHLFDRFFRADKARQKTQTLGYGLGLSIAKKIIDIHRGTIEVESVAGMGATFLLILPKKRIQRLLR